ncbi:MAG: hypothetical protein KUG81_04160 [Gammaproteobacteria bacterium]|nr:hypothetical protein [Gammaproteobacteria bacterium]
MDFDWKKLVSTAAPMIGTVIAGGNPLGGVALKVLAKALTGDEDTPEDKIKELMVNATPETLVQVKAAEQDFKIRMKELGIKKDQIIMADKDSARNREIKTGDKMPAILAIMLTVLLLLVLYALGFEELQQKQLYVLLPLVGSVATAWVGAMQYYFGTTKGSSDKNAWVDSK